MAEYITKEQVIEWLRPYGHIEEGIPYDVLVDDILEMKAADVAPVVRCKDCKYHRTLLKREMCAKNAIILDGNEVGLRATSEDFFCASGARMDGAE